MHLNSSNSPNKTVEDALERVAEPYRDEGYEVIVRPRGDQVPPFAAGLELHLIATRGIEGVIVVIKRNRIDLCAIRPCCGWRRSLTLNRGGGWMSWSWRR